MPKKILGDGLKEEQCLEERVPAVVRCETTLGSDYSHIQGETGGPALILPAPR